MNNHGWKKVCTTEGIGPAWRLLSVSVFANQYRFGTKKPARAFFGADENYCAPGRWRNGIWPELYKYEIQSGNQVCGFMM